jgi:hypothetical protein
MLEQSTMQEVPQHPFHNRAQRLVLRGEAGRPGATTIAFA